MALSSAFIDAHIAHWTQKLTSPIYTHRKHWPSCLFHHAPLDNAVAILRDGHLRSRDDFHNCQPRDVAAPGVIDARIHAHSRVRLYFRPKTPTQWHIEGIRKTGECAYGDQTHAEVLVMFALDAKVVLSTTDVWFSNKNMQVQSTVPGSSQEYFSSIPFDKVYSEGGTGRDKTITEARCAEVLPVSPLDLSDCLKAIFLRSEPERDTLLNALGDLREVWAPLCIVSDALKVFQKEYTFVQTLNLTSEGVVFRLNPRLDRKSISIKIDVWNSNRVHVIDFFNSDHAPYPNPPASNWIWPTPLSEGRYLVEVRLEGALAYRNHLSIGETLF